MTKDIWKSILSTIAGTGLLAFSFWGVLQSYTFIFPGNTMFSAVGYGAGIILTIMASGAISAHFAPYYPRAYATLPSLFLDCFFIVLYRYNINIFFIIGLVFPVFFGWLGGDLFERYKRGNLSKWSIKLPLRYTIIFIGSHASFLLGIPNVTNIIFFVTSLPGMIFAGIFNIVSHLQIDATCLIATCNLVTYFSIGFTLDKLIARKSLSPTLGKSLLSILLGGGITVLLMGVITMLNSLGIFFLGTSVWSLIGMYGFFVLVGGYLTTKMSPNNTPIHATIFGVFLCAILCIIVLSPYSFGVPFQFDQTLGVLIPGGVVANFLCSWLGGLIFTLFHKGKLREISPSNSISHL